MRRPLLHFAVARPAARGLGLPRGMEETPQGRSTPGEWLSGADALHDEGERPWDGTWEAFAMWSCGLLSGEPGQVGGGNRGGLRVPQRKCPIAGPERWSGSRVKGVVPCTAEQGAGCSACGYWTTSGQHPWRAAASAHRSRIPLEKRADAEVAASYDRPEASSALDRVEARSGSGSWGWGQPIIRHIDQSMSASAVVMTIRASLCVTPMDVRARYSSLCMKASSATRT